MARGGVDRVERVKTKNKDASKDARSKGIYKGRSAGGVHEKEEESAKTLGHLYKSERKRYNKSS